MSTVLLINPNTSAGVTDLMSSLVAPLLDAPLDVRGLRDRGISTFEFAHSMSCKGMNRLIATGIA